MATASDERHTASSGSLRQPHTRTADETCNGHHGNPITSPSIDKATSKRSSESLDTTSESSDSTCSEEAILKAAGVTFDLASCTSVDGHAPLELVAECVSCLLSDRHAAAQLLCQKVMELEPGNATVKEIYPLLQERLTLDQELPTESSSSCSESSSEPDSQSDMSEDDHTSSTEGATSTHCQH